MCLYPKVIKNKRYVKNRKNKGIIPKYTDRRVLAVPIACGKCIECRKQKANEWRVRLNEELRHDSANAKFMTLTFNEESLNSFESEDALIVASRAIELFRKRWYRAYKSGIKHFLVAELGKDNTERLHLHGIFWTDRTKEEIEAIWQYGFIDTGEYVNERTINYIVKYIFKIDEEHPNFQTKIWVSKGIGEDYLQRDGYRYNEYRGDSTRDHYRLPNGAKTQLPIYYRNKIYTEEEREKLWIQKLDKQIRYVCGEKIDVSTMKGMKQYFSCLEYHQHRSISLGYESDPWIKKHYKKSLESMCLLNKFED